MYFNEEWFLNTFAVSSHFSAVLEMLSMKCQPRYLPRGLAIVVVIAVYIPLGVNTKDLYSIVNNAQMDIPDELFSFQET